jgi:hypothetical protein
MAAYPIQSDADYKNALHEVMQKIDLKALFIFLFTGKFGKGFTRSL